MSSKSRLIIAILAVIASFALSSCATKRQDETSIPWSRPADWEGQIPGMGQ